MVKIKTKKQMNLSQLIEWGFENDIREKSFYANEYVGEQRQELHFNAAGIPKFSAFVEKSNTFTVEVEEEITEDTVIDNLYKMDEFYEFYSTEYKTIKDVIRHSVFKVKAVYLNDDLTMTLIWRKGKVVE